MLRMFRCFPLFYRSFAFPFFQFHWLHYLIWGSFHFLCYSGLESLERKWRRRSARKKIGKRKYYNINVFPIEVFIEVPIRRSFPASERWNSSQVELWVSSPSFPLFIDSSLSLKWGNFVDKQKSKESSLFFLLEWPSSCSFISNFVVVGSRLFISILHFSSSIKSFILRSSLVLICQLSRSEANEGVLFANLRQLMTRPGGKNFICAVEEEDREEYFLSKKGRERRWIDGGLKHRREGKPRAAERIGWRSSDFQNRLPQLTVNMTSSPNECDWEMRRKWRFETGQDEGGFQSREGRENRPCCWGPFYFSHLFMDNQEGIECKWTKTWKQLLFPLCLYHKQWVGNRNEVSSWSQ